MDDPTFWKSRWIDPDDSLTGAMAVLVVLGIVAWLARRIRLDFSWATAVLLGLVVVAFAGVGPAAVVVVQAISAFCLGRRLHRGVDIDSPLLDATLATAAGFALSSLVVGILSFFPVNNQATYLLLIGLPICWGWRENRSALSKLWSTWKTATSTPFPAWTAALRLLIGFALALQTLAALQPEVGADALAMHLVIAERLKEAGFFDYDVGRSIWAVMPMAGDWQFATAYMLGGEPAARILNLLANMLVVTLLYQYCARRHVIAGAVAAVVYVTTPLVYLETTSLFIENFWTLWALAALVVAESVIHARDERNAVEAGLLLGAALSAKVITVFLAPFFLVAVVAAIRLSPQRGIRHGLVISGVAALTGALPYLNAWLRTGNPVFPFMNDVFKSPLFQPAAFDNALFSAGVGWRTLYDVTFRTGSYLEAYPGAMGLAFMALLPPAFVFSMAKQPRLRWTALCVLAFVAAVFTFQSYARYVLPALPVLASLIGAMAAALAVQSMGARVLVLAVVAACGAAGLFLTPTSNFHHREVSLPVFAGSESEEKYLRAVRPERLLARLVDDLGLERVLWLGAPYIAGTGTDVRLVNWHGGFTQVARFDALDSQESFRRWVVENRFDGVVLVDGFDCSSRPFVCDFLATGMRSVDSAGGKIYVPEAGMLFANELLTNPTFDGSTRGWTGTAAYEPSGAVIVSASAAYSQSVPVRAGARYYLEVEGRCTPEGGEFRNQVNWLRADGSFIDTHIDVIACTPTYAKHWALVEAPDGASTAVVYASGHAPDRTADLTSVSFRQ
jgi:hypothetical protein